MERFGPRRHGLISSLTFDRIGSGLLGHQLLWAFTLSVACMYEQLIAYGDSKGPYPEYKSTTVYDNLRIQCANCLLDALGFCGHRLPRVGFHFSVHLFSFLLEGCGVLWVASSLMRL